MACGKGNANQPIEDFITHSPAPVDMAAKMSAIYTELSFKVDQSVKSVIYHKTIIQPIDLINHLCSYLVACKLQSIIIIIFMET